MEAPVRQLMGAGQAVLLSAAFRPDLQADRCGGGGVVSGGQGSYEHPTAGTYTVVRGDLFSVVFSK